MTATFRGSRLTDDWVFGKGLSDYMSDDDAIAKDIETKVRTFRGECFFDGAVGVRWFSILGQKDIVLTLLEIREVIFNVDGVTAVTDLRIEPLNDERTLVLRYWIDTVNTVGVQGSVEL
jgi:hypothetical protein